jgi:phage terminase large subunit GpA-like protein
LRTRWRHPFGGTLGVDVAIVDAGDGEHFATVLGFCVPRAKRHIFAGKGMAGRYPSIQMAKGQTIASKQAPVGVDTIKNAIFNRLLQHGRGIRFSNTLSLAYFEQLASEHLVVRYVRGMPKRRFERIGDRRAEALDCLVYGISAHASYQLTYDQREAELRAITAPPPNPGGLPHEHQQTNNQPLTGDDYFMQEAERILARDPELRNQSWLDPRNLRRGRSFWDRGD